MIIRKNQILTKVLSLGAAFAALSLVPGTASAGSNLVVDGGFEDPAPASTTPASSPGQGFVLEGIGASFGGAWTVSYAPGSSGFSGDAVALGPTVEYAAPNIFYNAHSGQQSLDLSGGLDNGHPAGVTQSIATTTGATYSLTFWVDSWVDQPDSLVSLYVNDQAAGTFENNSNNLGRGGLPQDANFPSFVDGDVWNSFTYDFTATGDLTKIGFFNASAGGVSEVGLDDVNLTPTGVPEPATWAAMLLGFGAVGVAMRTSRRRPTELMAAIPQ
jgi:PEP-CTERM motif